MKPGDSGHNFTSDDPLPDGWTVKVKVTTGGKKYKCYFPPSGESKFYSKLEVVRFLNKSNPKSEDKVTTKSKEEDTAKSEDKDKFVAEKSQLEGLPPGWTKHVKVTKKGHKIRRDPYYTDPVSGYAFRSMKGALRYLETGELGRLAFKPKDKGNDNVELEDDEACRPAAAKKLKLAVSETRSPIISDHSSKLIEAETDGRVLGSATTGESMPISECTSGVVGASINNTEIPEENNSSQTGRKSNRTKTAIATAVDLSIEQPLESGVMKDKITKTGLSKSKKKKDISLPRRASKRLAGLPLDTTPELQTTNRARGAAGRMSDDIVVSTNGCSSHIEQEAKCASESSKNTKNKGKHPIRHMPAPKRLAGLPLDPTLELQTTNQVHRTTGRLSDDIVASTDESSSHIEQEAKGASGSSKNAKNKGKHPIRHLSAPSELKTENKSNEKHEHPAVAPLSNLTMKEEHSGKIEANNNADEKQGLPLGELWQDPCIAFAIKTLTGISFNNSEGVQVSAGSNNTELGGLAALEDNGRKEDLHMREQMKQVQQVSSITTSEEHAGDVEISDKEKPGSPFNVPFADAWADPCIEFAIKTLTGAIPLDCDIVIQDHLQQKASSSQSQESSGLTLQNNGEPGVFCQQYSISEQPLCDQGALPLAKNMNLGYSRGTIYCQHNEDRSKEFRR